MSNLLPIEGKKNLRIEYWVRVASVWTIMWSFALCIIAILLGLTYILISSRLGTVEGETAKHATANNATFQDAKAAITRANNFAKVLGVQSPVVPSAKIISELDHELSPDIHLSAFSLTPDGKTMQLEIYGVAATREGLALFVDRLKKNPYFTDARVPVSDLAKAVDAPFSVKVAVTKK